MAAIDLQGAPIMHRAFGTQVCLVRKFFGVEVAEVASASVHSYLGAPALSYQPRTALQVDSEKAAFAVALRSAKILHVHAVWHVAQIVHAVVRAVSIDVINVLRRPVARHHQPDGAVFLDSHAANSDAHVSSLGRLTRSVAGRMSVGRLVRIAPPQAPCVCVVVEQSEKQWPNVVGSH
jgi:hypothetical protein